MKIQFVSLLAIVLACTGGNPSKDTNIIAFEEFISSFKTSPVPLILDREIVFKLSKTIYNNEKRIYTASPYNEMTEVYRIFLPEQIAKNQEISEFRCLYVLPKKNNIIPVIIAKDFLQEREQNTLQLFFITYTQQGKIIDYAEVGGYYLDISETFAEISSDYDITIRKYNFKKPPDNNFPRLFYMLETQTICKLNNVGKILKMSEYSKEGYFEGNGKSYSLKK